MQRAAYSSLYRDVHIKLRSQLYGYARDALSGQPLLHVPLSWNHLVTQTRAGMQESGTSRVRWKGAYPAARLGG